MDYTTRRGLSNNQLKALYHLAPLLGLLPLLSRLALPTPTPLVLPALPVSLDSLLFSLCNSGHIDTYTSYMPHEYLVEWPKET